MSAAWKAAVLRGERPYWQIVWFDEHLRRLGGPVHAIVILRPMSYVD